MKLTVLADNNTIIDRYFLGEPAVSYYLEEGGTRILFDTGYSDVYLKNAEALGCPIRQLDAVVLSHGHNDHTGGLRFFPDLDRKIPLIAHPAIFDPKYDEQLMVGCPVPKEELEKKFVLRLSRDPVRISPRLTWLGQIPRVTDFEEKPTGVRCTDGQCVPDLLPDDSALMLEEEDGLFIITGCSHAGICNIMEYAKKLSGKNSIKGVIGGFHLFDRDAGQIGRTVEYFRKENIPDLYPCHCTSFGAKCAMAREMTVHEVGVGLTVEW